MTEKTRTEELCFLLSINKNLAEKHKKMLKVFDPLPILENGDQLTIEYKVLLEYWGEVEKRLNVINKLVKDKDVVSHIELNELKYGHSILQNLLFNLKEIIDETT